MADKGVNGLSRIYNIQSVDLLPLHDNSEVATEKMKNITTPDFNYHQGDIYGNNILGIVIRDGIYTSHTTAGFGTGAKISVADLLVSIKGGVRPFIYAISKNYSGTWVSNVDPFLAYVDCSCDDGEVIFLSVRVIDAQPQTVVLNTYVNINCLG